MCGYCGADLAWAGTPPPDKHQPNRSIAVVVAGALVLALAAGGIFGLNRKGDASQSGQSTPVVAVRVAEPPERTTLPIATVPQAPTTTPTPDIAPIVRKVDAAWTKYDWPAAITGLEQVVKLSPNSLEYKKKLYDALMTYGFQLLAAGDRSAAGIQFGKAKELDPSRPEAPTHMAALTPTAIPTLTTAQRCAKAEVLDPSAIAKAPDSFKGRDLRMTGLISTVDYQYSGSYTLVQIAADIPSRPNDDGEPVAVKVTGRVPSGIVRGKWAKVCGTVIGAEEIEVPPTTTRKKIPVIQALNIE